MVFNRDWQARADFNRRKYLREANERKQLEKELTQRYERVSPFTDADEAFRRGIIDGSNARRAPGPPPQAQTDVLREFEEHDTRMTGRWNAEKDRYELVVYGVNDVELAELKSILKAWQAKRTKGEAREAQTRNRKGSRDLIFD